MNAMIFAAGLGTRLKPLTNNLPKALAPLNGEPLLWHAIKSMEQLAIDRVVVNIHHFSHLIKDYIASHQWDTEVIVSDESDLLLETGGGLLKAKDLFIPNQSILIQNVDVLTSTDIGSFIKKHEIDKSHATLMVKDRITSRYLVFDEQMNLCGWKNKNNNEEIAVRKVNNTSDFAFSGLHLIEPELLNEMGEVRPFSIIQAYLELAKHYKIKGYKVANNEAWFDVGTIEKLKEAELYYQSGK